ncbi:hypothetical protein CRG98_023201 [Punica granatum]|uniref:Uncharacterized protein n=1 Tax=Punica granatum TaxID=22663 RepID=A0A2I0JJG3_PUNGR|nr:hypothetical protein CRG98_023201 [Punica granatum]
MTNGTSGRTLEASCLKPKLPQTLTDAFPVGALEGPDPRTSKRHPETGLQIPKDHHDHGMSLRLPIRIQLHSPSGPRPGKRDSVKQNLALRTHSVEIRRPSFTPLTPYNS